MSREDAGEAPLSDPGPERDGQAGGPLSGVHLCSGQPAFWWAHHPERLTEVAELRPLFPGPAAALEKWAGFPGSQELGLLVGPQARAQRAAESGAQAGPGVRTG